MKYVKYFIFSLVGSTIFTAIMYSALSAQAIGTPIQVWGGGTGWAAIQSGTIPYGNGSSAISTTTAGTPGQVLGFQNGIPTWIASTTYANGTGITTSFSANTLTITNTGVISLTNGTNINCSGTNPGSCSFSGTLPLANGGTNATSFTTTGNAVYFDGTRLVTAPLTSAVTTPFASSTAISSTGGIIVGTTIGTNSGIGTSSPFAKLSIHLNNTGSILTAFAIGSSTQSSTTTLLSTTNGGQTASCEAKPATSTTMTVDFQSTCNQVLLQIGTAGVTITLSNAKVGDTKRIVVTNPNATAGTITWAGLVWIGGTAPTQTTTANSGDIYSCFATQATSTSAASPKVECAASTGLQ